MPIRSYELHVYYKQGDDFHEHVEATKTASAALRSWAEDLKREAALLLKVANRLRNLAVEAYGDTHLVSLTLRKLVKDKLVELVEIEDDDEEELEDANP